MREKKRERFLGSEATPAEKAQGTNIFPPIKNYLL